MADDRHVDAGAVALQGLVEQLVRPEPRQTAPHGAPGSGTAGAQEALTAVAQLARAIEVPAQAGDLDPDQAHRMASLLLVIRDFIDPIGMTTDDRVPRYLAEVVQTLRTTGADA